ncbi:putative transmembrane transcriptional regulator [Candidatus Koribacter versatilis Ellin345]|uniref:Transmembrane transcriptional regulator n=1 Tax=Koribacter versatilis (strain Ellin345) TaxID=204669 RepID=Q1ISW9_KORVE|nr:zf-HC2 domain-containing protein [Candidatus Koribacter versatilis]ABF40031.1 putative transmembrane transcriptional regulator [Candidatus Koribacter versatilis Ellin345]
MNGNGKFEMQCTDFDALLTDALDGLLEGERRARFDRHKAECSACSLLFQETKSGFDWLHTLDEVEPPLNLVHNVIAATTVAQVMGVTDVAPRKSWLERMKEAFLPKFAPVMTPRFAMSFGMAFFSISMLMSVAGVKPGDLRHMDLTPKGIRKTYYETQARATRYYENIRLVYQMEAFGRQLKKAATTPADQKQPSKPDVNENRSQDKDKREQNYSRQGQNEILAQIDRCRVSLHG